MPHRRFELIDQEWSQSTRGVEACARCGAKGIILCPECQGTGEKRNPSYVVIDRCHRCKKEMRGFITCPSCLGKKVVHGDRVRMNYRLEAERIRKTPAVWGFVIPTAPYRIPAR
jgi:hypothetical protein